MCFIDKTINIHSLIEIINPKYHSLDAVMYFGWEHCGFFPIKKSINDMCALGASVVKKHFDWKLSSPELTQQTPSLQQNLDGRKIVRVVEIENSADAGNNRPVRIQLCKATLVNIVFENYKRAQQGLSLIPVFFGIDMDNNPYPTMPHTVCAKDHSLNDKITHKELRRAYKLCFDPGVAVEIQTIARRTFVFLKVKVDDNGSIDFQSIDPVWSSKEWTKAWEQRKMLSNPKSKPLKTLDWRKNLQAAYMSTKSRL